MKAVQIVLELVGGLAFIFWIFWMTKTWLTRKKEDK